jgi:hypothetical protein
MIALLATALIQLTAPNGHRLDINPDEVSSLREPADMRGQHWAAGTRCIVVMTNGRFNAVVEDCETIRAAIH